MITVYSEGALDRIEKNATSAGESLVDLGRLLMEIRELTDYLEEQKGRAERLKESISGRMANAMTNQGMTAISIDGMGKFQTQVVERVAFDPGAGGEEAFIEYLDSIGQGDVARRRVMHQSLGAWWRDHKASLEESGMPVVELPNNIGLKKNEYLRIKVTKEK